MGKSIVVALVLASTSLLVACGPNCQTSCQRIYGNSANAGEEDCAIQRPGRDQAELIDQCMDYCEGALEQPGEIGTFDPYTRTGSNQSVSLENERQAAIWMECVQDTSCDRLQDGYCAPIW